MQVRTDWWDTYTKESAAFQRPVEKYAGMWYPIREIMCCGAPFAVTGAGARLQQEKGGAYGNQTGNIR